MHQLRALGLHADKAHYEPRTRKLVIELHSGARFEIPTALIQGLDQGTSEQLKNIEISPSGLGLHFPDLDADILIPGLLNGVMGNPAWMAGHEERIERVRSDSAARPPAKSLVQRPVAGTYVFSDRETRIFAGIERLRGGESMTVQVVIGHDGVVKDRKLVAKRGVKGSSRDPE